MLRLRRATVLQSLVLLACLSIPSFATTITTTAVFPGGFPQQITPNPTSFSFDLGTQFSTVTSVSFFSTFSGDLWDPNEAYFISGVGGQINLSPFSSQFASMSLNLANISTVDQIKSGSGVFQFFSYDGFGSPNATMTLADLTLTVSGETAPQVPEPGSLILMGSGLLGLAGLIRRRLIA